MFTGLVEALGVVQSVERTTGGSRITVEAPALCKDVQLGDSIAIDGVCTTVVAFDDRRFAVEASPETLRKTTLDTFRSGMRVNLERPLTPISRIGGHFVMGHVDGTARVTAVQPEGNSVIYQFELENPDLAQYLIPKGSIAVSGISLTVVTIEKQLFTVAIIPHTLIRTTLQERKIGDSVNIEVDVLGKYVKNFLLGSVPQLKPFEIDETFLGEHGFLTPTSL